MKSKTRLLFPCLLTVAFASLAGVASAADGTKADNTNALNTGASYTSPSVVPTGSDLLIIDSNLANPRTAVLGGNVSVKGITEGDADPKTFIPQMAAWYKEGKFPFDRLVTKFKFSEINEAAHSSEKGGAIKPVMVF